MSNKITLCKLLGLKTISWANPMNKKRIQIFSAIRVLKILIKTHSLLTVLKIKTKQQHSLKTIS